jgi:hypothetical protein
MNRKIRDVLRKEQRNYCAYSEVYIRDIDACDVEHFDETLKNTENDSYYNWYAVTHFFNAKKTNRKIVDFKPILSPADRDVLARIKFESGIFQPAIAGDTEAENLIKFLGMNLPELVDYRTRFVLQKQRDRRELFGSDTEFIAWMESDPENLSFISALEVELGLTFTIRTPA